MTPADEIIARAMVAHQIDLLRLSAGEQQLILDTLDRLGRELESMLRRDDLTAFNRARVNTLLNETTKVIDRYYDQINGISNATLQTVAASQSGASAQALSGVAVSLDAGLPSQEYLARLASNSLVQGAKTSSWWERQAGDTAFKFQNAVRQGLIQGETNEQIVRRVSGGLGQPGVMTVSKSNARSLVHSSIQQVANDARLDVFKKNPGTIKGVRQLSTLDSHTTEICIAYDGAEWDLDGEPIGDNELPFNGGPPRHWGCRSVLVPIAFTFKELGINIPDFVPQMRATSDGPQRMSMRQWMDSRTAEQLDDQLGAGRASLYRNGKITLTQLVDLRGNPLSTTQLERKYGSK